MTDPAVLIVERDTDLAAVQLQAEAALHAGRPVNVIGSTRGARTLILRAVPRRSDVLMTTVVGSAGVPLNGVSAALRRHLARTPGVLDQHQHERWS